MNAYELARVLYEDGKRLIDGTRETAVTDDLVRWAREDLEDVLLDLKLAVIEQNDDALARGLMDVLGIMSELRGLL